MTVFAGAVLGTPGYMPPEQARGGAVPEPETKPADHDHPLGCGHAPAQLQRVFERAQIDDTVELSAGQRQRPHP